ncbi:hypothetical protein AKJ16_DCAP25847 [Drosera capensis]
MDLGVNKALEQPPHQMKEATESTPTVEDDYSASATLVPYDHPRPLLRGPFRAGPMDNPSLGPYLLAFKDQQAFISAYKFCLSKVFEQCQSGVRIGCAIKASNECKPPWWKAIFGGRSRMDFKERELCEDREMAICIEESKNKCVEFTKEKCLAPFKSARIACREIRLDKQKLGRLISCISGLGALKNNAAMEIILSNQLGSILSSDFFYEMLSMRSLSEALGNGCLGFEEKRIGFLCPVDLKDSTLILAQSWKFLIKSMMPRYTSVFWISDGQRVAGSSIQE